MRKLRPTEEKSIEHISVYDVLASVGISIEVLNEHVGYAKGSFTDDKTFELVQRLSAANEMLAACVVEYRHLFSIAMVEVPPHLGAIKIKNPLFDADAKARYDEAQRADDELGDELPF